MGKKRKYRLLVGKPEGRRSLGRPRHRWSDNNRVDLVEVEWDDVDWIGLGEVDVNSFGFHKLLGNYRVCKQLGICRVVLSSRELQSSHSNSKK
jgi:hypothetical protein